MTTDAELQLSGIYAYMRVRTKAVVNDARSPAIRKLISEIGRFCEDATTANKRNQNPSSASARKVPELLVRLAGQVIPQHGAKMRPEDLSFVAAVDEADDIEDVADAMTEGLILGFGDAKTRFTFLPEDIIDFYGAWAAREVQARVLRDIYRQAPPRFTVTNVPLEDLENATRVATREFLRAAKRGDHVSRLGHPIHWTDRQQVSLLLRRHPFISPPAVRSEQIIYRVTNPELRMGARGPSIDELIQRIDHPEAAARRIAQGGRLGFNDFVGQELPGVDYSTDKHGPRVEHIIDLVEHSPAISQSHGLSKGLS